MIRKYQKFSFRKEEKRKEVKEGGITDRYGKMLIIVQTARPVVLKMCSSNNSSII